MENIKVKQRCRVDGERGRHDGLGKQDGIKQGETRYKNSNNINTDTRREAHRAKTRGEI